MKFRRNYYCGLRPPYARRGEVARNSGRANIASVSCVWGISASRINYPFWAHWFKMTHEYRGDNPPKFATPRMCGSILDNTWTKGDLPIPERACAEWVGKNPPRVARRAKVGKTRRPPTSKIYGYVGDERKLRNSANARPPFVFQFVDITESCLGLSEWIID